MGLVLNNPNDIHEFIFDSDGYLVIFVHGSCLDPMTPYRRAGAGVFFNTNNRRNICRPLLHGHQTHVRGLLYASILALREAKKYGYKVRIKTNLTFLVHAMKKWIKGWVTRDWMTVMGQPVKNIDMFKALLSAMQQLPDVDWVHTPRVDGEIGMSDAAQLSRKGAVMNRYIYDSQKQPHHAPPMHPPPPIMFMRGQPMMA